MNTTTSMNAQRNAMTNDKVRQAGVTDEMQAVLDQVQTKTLVLDAIDLYSRADDMSTADQIFNSYWMLRNNIINVL